MTASLDTERIAVHPLSGYTGAVISGVDSRYPLDEETVAEIRAALLRWKVVFFRDQQITPAQHIEFARLFGSVTPAHPTIGGLDEHPEILVVSDRQRLRAVQGDARPASEHDQNNWHVDVTFVPNPPFASILRGVVVPPYGGDTSFSNLVVVYETLSKPIRDLLDGLHAVHANILPPNSAGKGAGAKTVEGEAFI